MFQDTDPAGQILMAIFDEMSEETHQPLFVTIRGSVSLPASESEPILPTFWLTSPAEIACFSE